MPIQTSDLTPSETDKQTWTKKVTMTLVNGAWKVEFENRPGVPIVTGRDLYFMKRALIVGQRYLAQKMRLAERIASKPVVVAPSMIPVSVSKPL